MPRPRTLNNSGGFASNGIPSSTGIPTTRPAEEKLFGGTTFVLGGTASTKIMALDDAANFRRRGFNVNTVPITPFSNRRTGAIDTFGVYVATPEGSTGRTALAERTAKKPGRIAKLFAKSVAARSKRLKESAKLPEGARGVARVDVRVEARRAAAFGKSLLEKAAEQKARSKVEREVGKVQQRKIERAKPRPTAKRKFNGQLFTLVESFGSKRRAQARAQGIRKRQGAKARVVTIAPFENVRGKRITHSVYRLGR